MLTFNPQGFIVWVWTENPQKKQGNEEVGQAVVKAMKQTQCSPMNTQKGK